MNTRREMSGFRDLTGTVNPSGQRITRMVSRNPLRWEVTCDHCKTVQPAVLHARAQYVSCRNVTCGQTAPAPRSAQAQPGAPEAVRSRDSQSARQFRNAEAEREGQERQVAEEQATAERTQREEEQLEAVRERQRKYFAELILTGPDAEFVIDPDTLAGKIAVPRADVDRWNRQQAQQFKAACPEYARYQSNETFAALTSYIQRNANLTLVSARQWLWAFQRLRDLGLIHETPAPAPEPKPAPRPALEVNLGIERSGPETFEGIDPLTGEARTYTKRQVDRMSAAEYKARFPVIPTVAELLTAMKQGDAR